MSFHSAETTAHLQIQLIPSDIPWIRRHCARCKLHQRFVSSGRFRVNVQGKLIDVWLIYRCVSCDFTWNHAIHVRRPVRDIDARELQALMGNDPVLADYHAGDMTRLRGARVEIEATGRLHLRRSLIHAPSRETRMIRIGIISAASCQVRLDRVLAWGLSVRRSEVTALSDGAALSVRQQTAKALKRGATAGQEINIELALSPPEIAARCLQSLDDAEEVVDW